MREFLPQEIEGSQSLDWMLNAIYGDDRHTKGNGTYVEAGSDRCQARSALRRERGRAVQRNKTTVHVLIEGALARSSVRPKRG